MNLAESHIVHPAILAGIALAVAVVWDVLFYIHTPGISVPIFWILILGSIVLLDRFTHKQMSWRAASLAVLILILSSWFAIRASELLMVLNGLAIAYLFFLFLAEIYGAQTRRYRFFDFFVFPILDLAAAVLQRLGIFSGLVHWRSTNGKRIAIGIVCALVFVGLFALLFASADAIFAKHIETFFDNANIEKVIEHGIIIALWFLAGLLTLAPAFWKRVEPRNIKDSIAPKNFGLETLIVFAASNALFLAFIAIQAMYLFGGKQNLAAFNITYANYAREGFFQLLLVAVIVMAMIWGMRFVDSLRQGTANKILQVTLILQTFVVLASSWARLSLYEEAFGFTHLRLLSHYFLVVVAILLVILLVSITVRLSHNIILRSALFTFVFALIGLNLLNPDLLIAKQNIARVQTDKPFDVFDIDIFYLTRSLSQDAMPAIAPFLLLYQSSSPIMDTEIRSAFSIIKYRDIDDSQDWQSWNWSRANARKLVTDLKGSPLWPN